LERELLSVRNARRSKDLFNSFTRRITVMLTVAENPARQIRLAAESAPRGSRRPNAPQTSGKSKTSLTWLKHLFIVRAYPSAGSPNNRQGRLAFRVLQQGDLQ